MQKPKKWTQVYPYGTAEGSDESKFFQCLARNPKYEYQSTKMIVTETGLSEERVEEIIDKYATKFDPPLVYPHPTQDNHWGYWERCEDRLDDDKRSISSKEKDNRIDRHLDRTPEMTEYPNGYIRDKFPEKYDGAEERWLRKQRETDGWCHVLATFDFKGANKNDNVWESKVWMTTSAGNCTTMHDAPITIQPSISDDTTFSYSVWSECTNNDHQVGDITLSVSAVEDAKKLEADIWKRQYYGTDEWVLDV